MINKIKNDLLQLGVMPGGNLLVHASLKSLGNVSGGPQTVIRGILDALGDQGTLLMPALSYASVDEEHNVFDLINTPCCVGALPEFFRTFDGVVRSTHPTHSVSCWGKNKHLFTESHHKDTTPCGKNSPFHLLPKYNGQILMIGCGLKPNTSMHAIEEEAEVPYLFKEAIKYKILSPGNTVTDMSVKRHNFTGYFHQCYDRLEPLLSTEAMKIGKVLQADCFLIDAAMMWRTVLSAMKTNPYSFVDPVI